jgi:hypothetical protein
LGERLLAIGFGLLVGAFSNKKFNPIANSQRLKAHKSRPNSRQLNNNKSPGGGGRLLAFAVSGGIYFEQKFKPIAKNQQLKEAIPTAGSSAQ